jgi:hypothetical protein
MKLVFTYFSYNLNVKMTLSTTFSVLEKSKVQFKLNNH